MAIAEKMLASLSYHFDAAGTEAFREYIAARRKQPHFANARSIRNALDRMRLRQANRYFEQPGLVTLDDLMTIGGPDIRASRVFQAGQAEKKT
jgi:hypothetical protein